MYDFAIIGAGMAGASLAAEIVRSGSGARVLLLEGEDQPGYHTTGRSAAFWSETYGGPGVVPLSLASGDYLQEHGFLHRRGALHMVRYGDEADLHGFIESYAGTGAKLEKVGRSHLESVVPALREEWVGAVHEPACADIDVAGLHQHYLAIATRGGAKLQCRAHLVSAGHSADGWQLTCGNGQSYQARVLVNAAGAWADNIATLAGAKPLDIRPYKRTVVQLALEQAPPPDLPLILDMAGSFYFKPDNGRLWLSPHDEDLCDPCDAAADELAVAQAIDRFQRVVDWPIARVERRWAGLRSFAPDRLPVYGFATDIPDFFWFAGQGGFGIQTAPAAASLGASILLGETENPAFTRGLARASYSPDRFSGG
ncbi:NAD(P)/FAD-dependent oxidoreductase [Qipengyuania sp. DSG2-2]|uniref:NAD(P)/FAD-dependent oxidoreductase n=1 Tax=Qipengyuania sp. DGS2-2 TaxID=3349631 RepID=UPI0036D41794